MMMVDLVDSRRLIVRKMGRMSSANYFLTRMCWPNALWTGFLTDWLKIGPIAGSRELGGITILQRQEIVYVVVRILSRHHGGIGFSHGIS